MLLCLQVSLIILIEVLRLWPMLFRERCAMKTLRAIREILALVTSSGWQLVKVYYMLRCHWALMYLSMAFNCGLILRRKISSLILYIKSLRVMRSLYTKVTTSKQRSLQVKFLESEVQSRQEHLLTILICIWMQIQHILISFQKDGTPWLLSMKVNLKSKKTKMYWHQVLVLYSKFQQTMTSWLSYIHKKQIPSLFCWLESPLMNQLHKVDHLF